MKKAITLALTLVLCMGLACPAFAADNGFVPSITYKGSPDIVAPEGDGEIIGIVREEVKPEEVKSYVNRGCLVLTPVAEAETSEAIPQKAKEVLLEVYRELSSGRMKLPYDKVEGYNGEAMVIRELLDASWLCGGASYDHDHPTEVKPEGVVVELIFDLGVKPEDKLIVMTYGGGEWHEIVEVENKGDGTVRCVLEELGPIAISVAQPGAAAAAKQVNAMPWVVILVGAAAAAVALIVVFGKRKKQ